MAQTLMMAWPVFLGLLFVSVSVSGSVLEAETWPCPAACQCLGNWSVDCSIRDEAGWPSLCIEINRFVKQMDDPVDLHLSGVLATDTKSLSFDFNCLSLSFVKTLNITYLPDKKLLLSLASIDILDGLILSHNKIETLPDDAFTTSGKIRLLDLSDNSIESIGGSTFLGLDSLQLLDLSCNQIKYLNRDAFQSLENLTYLNLGHNFLDNFASWQLPVSASVHTIILANNNIKSFYIGNNESDTLSISKLQSLDISENPLKCSCNFRRVIDTIGAGRGKIINIAETMCFSPSSLQNKTIDHLNSTSASCLAPHSVISYPSKEMSILFRAKITLECRAEASPSPHIMWITPWGQKFSNAPISLLVLNDLAKEEDINVRQEYADDLMIMNSVIEVEGKNELSISSFRGSMAGNFYCVAFNEVGKKREVIHLEVFAMIKSIYTTSLIIASYCASCCLLIGVLIGFIHILVKKLQHKKFFKVPLFTPATSVCPAEKPPSSEFSDMTPPTSPLLGCASEKSTFSSDPNCSPSKRSHHFRDTIGGARDKLRDGVGRKMESVKRNVQSIKESTGNYMHTIMESGSSAANKMKAGVVMGVETVKYHVQSVKELCGTGNMGTHTVSVVSVQTDIDTNECTSVVKQITYV